MEYPDDNCIPIFRFPFYARKSKVKGNAPVRKSGAFLIFPIYHTTPGTVSFVKRNCAWVFFSSEKI